MRYNTNIIIIGGHTVGALKFTPLLEHIQLFDRVWHSETHLASKWFWKYSCQYKHKVVFGSFSYLWNTGSPLKIVLNKGTWFRSFLHACFLCSQGAEEALKQLFLVCDFSSR